MSCSLCYLAIWKTTVSASVLQIILELAFSIMIIAVLCTQETCSLYKYGSGVIKIVVSYPVTGMHFVDV